MIISKTPLRMSFVGGGSDLPSFYKNYSGSVISTTINQYVYINVHKSFDQKVRLAYSEVEKVNTFAELKHPLVRGAAELLDLKSGLEITSIADIPAKGSGLGSSSSFSVGLLHALSVYLGKITSKRDLAELACKLEIEICKQPIGKQDQFAASFGGFNIFNFSKDNFTKVQKIRLKRCLRLKFLQNIMVFYTGQTRNASEILADQNKNISDKKKISQMIEMTNLVLPFKRSLVSGDIEGCGKLLNQNWDLKKQMSSNVSNNEIDYIYKKALESGAYGGKLLGAGNGGFMLFLVPISKQSAVAYTLRKLKRVYWNFENQGSTIIYSK